MIRRHTRTLPARADGIHEAAAILRAGGLVAFPTETVYGLGAHALNADAVRAIFEAKGRPADDPVIVHVGQPAQLETIAEPADTVWRLAQCFWPGPLTLVLPKLPSVPYVVTAGLETVAVRIPSHPVALALLEATGLPLAAPSANLFGRPSPTHAQHVLDDLDGRIDAVIDGGPATIGVESTIVDLSTSSPRLLRAGGLAAEDIEAVLGVKLRTASKVEWPQPAPGMLAVHYAPRTPLTLIVGPRARERLLSEVQAALEAGQRVGVIALEDDLTDLQAAAQVEVVGAWARPSQSAARLFEAIRSLDAHNLDVLFARELADSSVGIGRALADRLRRGATHIVPTHE